MVWFKFLTDTGFYEPSKNPSPVRTEDGYHIPYWQPLAYLEKLSAVIAGGSEAESIQGILDIIINVSDNPVDNYHTWHSFIRILCNIPNEKIPSDVFRYIPVWLSGRFEPTVQSAAVCRELVPKFLLGDTKEDAEKAEIILTQLLSVERKAAAGDSGNIPGKYIARVQLYYLYDLFSKQADRIISVCSERLILHLAAELKKLLQDYPQGIQANIEYHEKSCKLIVFITGNNLDLTIREAESDDAIVTPGISDYTELDEAELRMAIIRCIVTGYAGFTDTNSNEQAVDRICFALNNDFSAHIMTKAIHTLGDKYVQYGEPAEIFSVIFRDLLDNKAAGDAAVTEVLLRSFFYEQAFRLPFYKRTVLHVIGKHWQAFRAFFFELIANRDQQFRLFSNPVYEKELYQLLSQNQHELTTGEKEILDIIISAGPADRKKYPDEQHQDFWGFRWYSALSETEPFRSAYHSRSVSLQLNKSHFENEGVFRFSRPLSPLSTADIQAMTTEEIAAFIHDFKETGDWKKPSISGLSADLGKAVELDPEKFAANMDPLGGMADQYLIHVLYGFLEARIQKRHFDWKGLLIFCQHYITRKISAGEKEKDSIQVAGIIQELLIHGMRSDEDAFDAGLLPLAREIILDSSKLISLIAVSNKTGADNVANVLNSAPGKLFRAAVEYALRKARVENAITGKQLWEPALKELFECGLDNGVQETYTVLAMYFPQLYFLDKPWISALAKAYYTLEEKRWHYFLSGLFYGSPSGNTDIYHLLYPHYRRAVENSLPPPDMFKHGPLRHIMTFYFWDMETSLTTALLHDLIRKTEEGTVREIEVFILMQEPYYSSADETEKLNIRNKIYNLWDYLAGYYTARPANSLSKKELASLADFLVFFPVLTEPLTALILISAGSIVMNFDGDELIQNLLRLKDFGDAQQVAGYTGRILSSLDFTNYYSDSNDDALAALIGFLFTYGQKKVAVVICNKLTKLGHTFAERVYAMHVH